MRVYPIYKVKVLKPITLANNGGQIMNLSVGETGTFQAVSDPMDIGSGKILIEAKFHGSVLRFQPKYTVPRNDIRSMLTKNGELEILLDPIKLDGVSKFTGEESELSNNPDDMNNSVLDPQNNVAPENPIEQPKMALISKYQTRSTIATSAGMGIGATLLAVGLVQKKTPFMIAGGIIFGLSYILVDNPTYN